MAELLLRLNGRERRVDGDPADSLLAVPRDGLALTGSKFGCGEGQCGACTVLIDGQTTRSCVTRLGTLGAKSITTIEGIGEPRPAASRSDRTSGHRLLRRSPTNLACRSDRSCSSWRTPT